MNGFALALGAVGALALGALVRGPAGSRARVLKMRDVDPYLTNANLDALVQLGSLIHENPTSVQRNLIAKSVRKLPMDAGVLLDVLTESGIPWASAWRVPLIVSPLTRSERDVWEWARVGREGWIRDVIESAEQALKDFEPYANGGEYLRLRQRLDLVIQGRNDANPAYRKAYLAQVRREVRAETGSSLLGVSMDEWIRHSHSDSRFVNGTLYWHARDAVYSAMSAFIQSPAVEDIAAIYFFAGKAAAQVRMKASHAWRIAARDRCQKRLLLRALIAHELVGEDG